MDENSDSIKVKNFRSIDKKRVRLIDPLLKNSKLGKISKESQNSQCDIVMILMMIMIQNGKWLCLIRYDNREKTNIFQWNKFKFKRTYDLVSQVP